MNLLFLTYAYLPTIGGVQRSVYNLSAELAARGHSILVVSHGEEAFAYDRPGPVGHLRIRIPTAFSRGLRKKLANRWRDVYNLAVLAKVCREHRIEIIHCHLINMDTRYAFALRKLLGVKVIVTMRGGEMGHWIEGMPHRGHYVRKIIAGADGVTALSQAQLARAERFAGTLPAVSAAIPNPAHPQRLATLAAGDVPAHPYVIYAGRLEREKSVEVLLRAYHLAAGDPEGFPLDLVVAGDGSWAPALREIAAQGAGASRIHFPGECTYGRTLELIRRAAVLVLPTEIEEGCPNAVLEAMALGVPVVVSALPQLVEIVRHGVNGETFPPGGHRQLAAILQRLARDPEARQRYADGGRRQLESRHRMDQIVERYEELYRRILGRKND